MHDNRQQSSAQHTCNKSYFNQAYLQYRSLRSAATPSLRHHVERYGVYENDNVSCTSRLSGILVLDQERKNKGHLFRGCRSGEEHYGMPFGWLFWVAHSQIAMRQSGKIGCVKETIASNNHPLFDTAFSPRRNLKSRALLPPTSLTRPHILKLATT